MSNSTKYKYAKQTDSYKCEIYDFQDVSIKKIAIYLNSTFDKIAISYNAKIE